MYAAEKIEEVKKCLAEGKTYEETATLTKIPPRTVRHWKLKGRLELPPAEDASMRRLKTQWTRESTVVEKASDKMVAETGAVRTALEELNSKTSRIEGRIGEVEARLTPAQVPTPWPDITAGDLARVGFKGDVISSIMLALEASRAADDRRFHRFMKAMTDTLASSPQKIPEAWAVLVAGFPIIAEDLHSPALAAVAALARELHPYLNKQMRQTYHRRVKHLLVEVLADVQAVILATRAPIMLAPDVLVEGKWAVLQQGSAMPDGFWDRNWLGVLVSVVTMLPDVDRPKKATVSKQNLAQMVWGWCATPLASFKPAIPTPNQVEVRS